MRLLHERRAEKFRGKNRNANSGKDEVRCPYRRGNADQPLGVEALGSSEGYLHSCYCCEKSIRIVANNAAMLFCCPTNAPSSREEIILEP